jgi:biopolymer transport protein TolQ
MRAPEPSTIKLDAFSLLEHASGPVKLTVALLILASTLVWVITALKWIQLGRLRSAQLKFEQDTLRALNAGELFRIAQSHTRAPGARIVTWLELRGAPGSTERLRAIVERAMVAERQRAASMMGVLGTIASVSPFVGLFGTVYGIIDAFVRISAEKSASLPVVAPAIGEALIATAIGLAAAIPAVIFYNVLDKKLGDLEAELDAAADEWVHLISESRSA